MKKLILFSLLLFSINSFAQLKDITGVNGINFGISKEQLKTIAIKNNWKFEYSKNFSKDESYLTNMKIGTLSSKYAIIEFFNNKIFKIYISFDIDNKDQLIDILYKKYGNCSSLDTDTIMNEVKFAWKFNKNRELRFWPEDSFGLKESVIEYLDRNIYEAKKKFENYKNLKAF